MAKSDDTASTQADAHAHAAAGRHAHVPPGARQHGDRERHDELPLVRADVLGLPRDPVGARDRHHRRRLHAARRDLRDGVRHDRRPAPQAPGDDLRRASSPSASFVIAGALYLLFPESALLDLGGPWFWIFSGIILFGAVIENMRNIALSTTVTLLVPEERHANANGMVGTVQGARVPRHERVQRARRSASSAWGGRSLIAIALLGGRARAPAVPPHPGRRSRSATASERAAASTSAAASRAVRAAPGLFALIIFSTFNNLIGGVYMALMDPYGLDALPGRDRGASCSASPSTGFIIGGLADREVRARAQPDPHDAAARHRDGRCSVRSSRSASGGGCTRSASWLYMTLIPAVEAAEQTVIQKVVPFRRQGRVFGFARGVRVGGRADHRVPHRADRRSS